MKIEQWFGNLKTKNFTVVIVMPNGTGKSGVYHLPLDELCTADGVIDNIEIILIIAPGLIKLVNRVLSY